MLLPVQSVGLKQCVSEIMYNVSSGTLKPAHSLTLGVATQCNRYN